MTALAAPFLMALLVALGATVACERVARRAGLVAQPREDRWHRQAVPLLGGVAMMLAVVASFGLVGGHAGRFGPFLLLALTMGAVGLVDDIRTLRPEAKLVAQIVLAAILIQLGFLLRLTPSIIVNVVLTLVWVVGITNAFNLLDNMDGLAAGMATLTAAFRLAFFLMEGDLAGARVTAAFLGAVSGFLIRNFPPAKVFMGDAGSLFLGFFLSGVCLVGESPYTRGVAAVLVFPVLLVLVPIFDTTFVTVTRLVMGRPPSRGGRDHMSHRLVALGITERQTLALLLGVSALSGLLAILSYRYGFTHTVVLLALLLVGLVLLGVHLSEVQVVGADQAPGERRPIVRLVVDFPFIRHVATVAIDLVLIVVAYYTAHLLRFEEAFEAHRETFLRTVGPVIVLEVLVLALSGTYRGLWRYTSLPDLLQVLRAATVGVGASALYFVFTVRFEALSRAVFVLNWLLLVVLLGGSRVLFRLLGERLRPRPGAFHRVLIYGAGAGGELTLREFLNNPALQRTPVGFIDDDRSKHRTQIHGLPVLGGADRLEELIRTHQIAEVVVATSKIREEKLRRLAAACRPLGVSVIRASLRLE